MIHIAAITNTDNNVILAVDVAYQDNTAVVAGVLFHRWDDMKPYRVIKTHANNIEEYIPGQFYRRELPCILALFEQIDVLPKIIIIDGFVYLGSERRAGLGLYLYEALHEAIPVIGVSKNQFQDTPTQSAIFRGNSRKPLFVTAVGIDETTARNCIMAMHGDYRIPTLLKRVDQLSKQD